MTNVPTPNPDAFTEAYWNPSGHTVSQEARQAFADRLHRRMIELGLTQADLARQAFGLDDKGKVVDREKISLWLRGQGLPGEEKMRKLAYALGMRLVDLAPQPDKSPMEKSTERAPETVRHMKLRRPVPINSFATVQLRPGGRVILQLELSNELAHVVMAFAQKKVEQAAAAAEPAHHE